MSERICGFSGCLRKYDAVRVNVAGQRMTFCCVNHAWRWLQQFDLAPDPFVPGARVARSIKPEMTGRVVARHNRDLLAVRWDDDDTTTQAYILRRDQVRLLPTEE